MIVSPRPIIKNGRGETIIEIKNCAFRQGLQIWNLVTESSTKDRYILYTAIDLLSDKLENFARDNFLGISSPKLR